MKLRSGKVLKYNMDTLPQKLATKLENSLQGFKELFNSNREHAKELLTIINNSRGLNDRFVIRDKIEEIQKDNKLSEKKVLVLNNIVAELRWLVIGNSDFYKQNNIEPIYKNIIQDKIENFNLESSLLGDMEY